MIKILYAGFGEIGIRGLSNLFSSFDYNPSNIFILIDNNNDFIFNDYCSKYNLETLYEDDLESHDEFDLCLSVHWRRKIRNETLSLCRKGGLNLHPSLLPKYAGCSSLVWALLNNEKFVGYSWHEITDEFDKGNIVIQESIDINKSDTGFSLWNKVNNSGVDKILDVIQLRLSQEYKSIKQDLEKRIYYKRGFPSFDEALAMNKNLDKKTYERAKYFPGK